MTDYLARDAAILEIQRHGVGCFDQDAFTPEQAERFVISRLKSIPAADVIDEENALKFYYVRSIDDYWIGQRVGNFYYAEFDPEALQWTWTHSRYLPWGEHVVSPTSLWKEHTYPSKPEEIPFEEWLRGLIKKYFLADDVRPGVRGVWVKNGWSIRCSICGYDMPFATRNFCPNCGANMREAPHD